MRIWSFLLLLELSHVCYHGGSDSPIFRLGVCWADLHRKLFNGRCFFFKDLRIMEGKWTV